MKIELRAPGQVKPYEGNPRINKQAVAAVARSIEQFGFRQPVVVDKHGVIVVGHTRWLAAKKLKLAKIPVHVATDLSAAKARAYRLADNRTGDLAEWDLELLPGELKALAKTSVDLAGVGFDAEAVRKLLTGSEGYKAGEGYIADTVKKWRGDKSFYQCPGPFRKKVDRAEVIVVQFSGGKDSSACLLWARHNWPKKRLVGVFSDPGVEFPGMGQHVVDAAASLKAEAVILKPKDEWWAWLAKAGEWPSLLFRPCAHKMIHGPFGRWMRDNMPAGKTVILTGSRAEEAGRGSKKTPTSDLSSLGSAAKKYPHFAPMYNVRKETIGQALRQAKVPLWEGYSRGFVRTACWCCPGQCGAQACALVDNYPGLADDIRRWEKRIGIMRPLNKISFDDILRAGRRAAAKAAKKSAPGRKGKARTGKARGKK